MLTTFDTDEDAFAALRAGAGGFLLKNAPPADLLAAVRAVACGNAMVAPRVTRRLLDRFAAHLVPAVPVAHSSADRPALLTEREHEVLLLVAQAGRTPRSASGCMSPRRP